MPDVESSPAVHGRPEAFPIARVNLAEEIRAMRASPRRTGHLAKTLLHGPDLRIVLMLVDRGTKIPEHTVEGSLTFQTVEGRVVIGLLESSIDVGAGELLAIERGVPHAIVAIEDSALLLTIAWTGHRTHNGGHDD